MSLSVVFHPQAALEVEDGWAWYELQRPGLGDDFVACVEAAVARAARDPEASAYIAPGVRRALTRRFPFSVVYAVAEDALIVLAVAHVKRRPGYWLGRRDD